MVALRVLAGLGVGGSVPIVFSTMGEFCTAQARWVPLNEALCMGEFCIAQARFALVGFRRWFMVAGS